MKKLHNHAQQFMQLRKASSTIAGSKVHEVAGRHPNRRSSDLPGTSKNTCDAPDPANTMARNIGIEIAHSIRICAENADA